MSYIRKLPGVIIYCDMLIHRRLLHGIAHRKLCDKQVAAETIYFIFYGFLKAQHYKKRNDTGGEANANAGHGNSVYSGRETTCLFAGYSA